MEGRYPGKTVTRALNDKIKSKRIPPVHIRYKNNDKSACACVFACVEVSKTEEERYWVTEKPLPTIGCHRKSEKSPFLQNWISVVRRVGWGRRGGQGQ